MTNGESTTAARLETIKEWLMNLFMLILLYVVICLAVSLYARFVSDRSDPSSMWYNFPKWVQPAKAWKKMAGIEVGSYSYIESAYAVQSTAISGEDATLSNVSSVNDCMLVCEANAPDCVGFSFNKISNTCSLASTLDSVVPSDSSNIMYFSDSSPPMKQYFVTPGKVPATPSPITISSVSIPTSTNVATVTTTAAHGFTTGNYVTTTGYGSNVITVTDSTHFTFPYRVTTDVSVASGTATLVLSLIPPDSTLSYIQCAQACTSNTTCSGFTFDTASGCMQYTTTPFNKEMLTQSVATSNTYINGTPVLTSYTSSYY